MQLLEFKPLYTPTSVDEVTSQGVAHGFELMWWSLSRNLRRGVRDTTTPGLSGGNLEEGFEPLMARLRATVDKLNRCR